MSDAKASLTPDSYRQSIARPPQAGDALQRALAGTVWIAVAFCVLLCAVMLYNHLTATTNDPWKSPQLLALKEKLVLEPKNEEVKQDIRRLDFEFRQHYRRRLALDGFGGWLLLGGALALVLAARQAAELRKQLPRPQPARDSADQARHAATCARWAVVAVGGVAMVIVAAFALNAGSPLPASAAELDKLLGRGGDGTAVSDAPSPAEFAANWPRFRGPTGGAVAAATNLPLSWDEKSGAGILWKSALPVHAPNSPVVWSNRVFLTGGSAAKREVLCYDATTGQLLWQRAVENVPGSPAKPPEVPEETTFAAPTAATDGRRVFAVFANGDLAALTVDGAPAWSKNIGVPKNPYGYATSLALWPGRLIVQLDQDSGAPGGSRLLCFDAATGRQIWERARQTTGTWSTPIVIEAAGKVQIITLGLPHVTSYALADGAELWRAELLEGEVTPSPVFAGGLVLVVSPSAKLVALRPDGAGDVTKSHAVWTNEDNQPDVTSPVASAELAFTANSGGLLTCFDMKDGKKLWEKDLEMEVQASPSLVGNKVLVLGTKGLTVVCEAGREFKEVSRSELADHFLASPAFAGGRMYLRGATNLWCIGAATEKGAKP
jgi:outer membrane protein assembly factor BamB